MFMAIAAEQDYRNFNRNSYKVWYLEINKAGDVVGIGSKSKEEVVESIFANYSKTGVSNWRAFSKNKDESHAIEIYDFISKNENENTHFGNLPTLSEFQSTLNALSGDYELQAIA